MKHCYLITHQPKDSGTLASVYRFASIFALMVVWIQCIRIISRKESSEYGPSVGNYFFGGNCWDDPNIKKKKKQISLDVSSHCINMQIYVFFSSFFARSNLVTFCSFFFFFRFVLLVFFPAEKERDNVIRKRLIFKSRDAPKCKRQTNQIDRNQSE